MNAMTIHWSLLMQSGQEFVIEQVNFSFRQHISTTTHVLCIHCIVYTIDVYRCIICIAYMRLCIDATQQQVSLIKTLKDSVLSPWTLNGRHQCVIHPAPIRRRCVMHQNWQNCVATLCRLIVHTMQCTCGSVWPLSIFFISPNLPTLQDHVVAWYLSNHVPDQPHLSDFSECGHSAD